ncbi:MAG: histidine phosphatase family protein [Mycetocola sp.]
MRHGQTDSNVRGLLDSAAPGADLNDLGRAQATAIPAALRGRDVSSVTVSNLVRTGQTARPLADDRLLNIRIDPDVREIPAGHLEMRGDKDAYDIYTTPVWDWSRGDLEPRVPGSENGREFFERFDAAIDRATALGGDAPVIVSHAACIRVWVGRRAQNVSTAFAVDTPLHNTGSALLERNVAGRWELLRWQTQPMGGSQLDGASGESPGERSDDSAGKIREKSHV